MHLSAYENYIKDLCQDIKVVYTTANLKNGISSNWNKLCQEHLGDFVLSRQGWNKSTNSNEVFLYKNKYPLEINILHAGSTSMLMILTATGIAQAEILDEYDVTSQDEQNKMMDSIEILVKKQNWMITFPRKRLYD